MSTLRPRRRSDASSRRSTRTRRRALLATTLAALGVGCLLVLASAGHADARGAPKWLTSLSRFFRAAPMRAESSVTSAVPNDTVVLFGPKVLSLGAATTANFVERFVVSGLPANTLVPETSGYLLRATNGPNGLGGVTGGSITLNGAVVVTASQLAALSAGASLTVPVQVTPSDTLVAALTGPGGSGVSVSVLSAPDPTFVVFGPKQYERVNGTPVTITERFTVPQGGVAPSYLCVRNGELDGTRRNSSATVVLNGVTVVSQAELNQQVAGFRKKVTFLPAGQENVLQVQLQGSPGSRLTLCAAATDAAPPTITVTAPAKGLITNKPDADAVGVVNDQTAVTITVNGQAATVTPGTQDNTSFTAKVPLAAEGANTVTIHAVDAAGNATDSVRTVIRDTQAPVVTLDALPDSVLYRRDSVMTITGTITDRTAITANVNGTPLVVDSAAHTFSQVVTLAQGTNFIAITATDAAGNATSVVRQVTLDNVPPTLTLTAPAAGLVTKTATVQVTGSAVGQSAVTVTVNGAPTALGANGAFTASVALAEGSNTLTVVASNAAGVTATATRTVILDTQPPAIAWSAPVDSAITKLGVVDVTGSITDRTPVTLTLNGAAVGVTVIDPNTSSFLGLQPLVDDGQATLTLVATDAAGNVTTLKRTITKDATAPVITVIEPIDGQVTNAALAHVVGSVADLTKSTLTVNGAALALAADGGFVSDLPIVAGSNTLTFVATDGAGNQSTVTRTLVRDIDPPVVTMSSPSDNVLVKTPTVTVTGTITDASAVTAMLNGAALLLAADGSYQTSLALSEGPNTLTLVATDAAGNATTTTRSITLDTTAPVLTVTSPADGFTTQEDNVAVAGTATDQSSLRVTVNGAPATLASGGAFSATAALTIGANSIQIVATDSAGNTSTASRNVTREPAIDPNLPPNPKTVAPALDRTVATTQAAATSFLYTGSNPIQTGVAAGTIVATRASTLRGRVITQAGAVLPGASITILGHPEYGSTKSRADGWYDLVVNGGGTVTVQYAKDGYLGAERVVRAPSQDYGRIDDVALIKPDPVVTPVQLGGAVQVAQGSAITDADGARKATMIVDAGTTATLKLPNGTTQPISSLSMRLTEYTVGANGREAMPAPLPPSSGYTYAVSPTADEALAVGGTVTFSKPVSAYVEDFLGFPVGMKVPLGVLDPATTTWVPQPDGRVIKVLSVSGGAATIDANGDGAADPQIVLDSLGFSTTELQQLAATYTPGATLMRTRLFGLYPFDANLPFRAHGVDPVVVAPPGCASATRDIIKCDVRVATQAVDVPGTPYTLAYTSARAAGAADRTLRIPVTGATMPAELMGAYVRVWVAGQMTEQQYAPAANITYEYQWDGNDAYGRPVQGNPTAVVEIGHLFPVEYQIPASVAQSFGLPCAGSATTGTASCVLPYNNAYDTERHSFWRVSTATTKLGGLDAKAQGLGGFDFNVHHQYDPVGRVLYLGDGTTRIADAISPVVTTVLGNGCDGYAFDNIKATDSCLFYPHGPGLAALPDGSFLVGNAGSMRRVRPDGIVVRFAGNYPPCPPCYSPVALTGEGGPATNAYVSGPSLPVVASDGVVYFADGPWFKRILRVTPDGILTRVVGDEAGTAVVDGKPVSSTRLGDITALAVGPDNAIYFSQRQDPTRVYRIGPDSVIHTFAGKGVWGSGGDEGLARQAEFVAITALAFGPDGSLYIGTYDESSNSTYHNRVRRVTPDGIVHLVAGGGGAGGSGLQATTLSLYKVQSLAVSREGVVNIGVHNIVYQVTPDGISHYVAGDYTTQNFGGDNGPSLKAGMSLIVGLTYMADGSLLIYDGDHHRVRKMAAPMPGFGGGAFLVASEDGSQVYSFDAAGRHLKTLDLRTGKELYSFTYDPVGLLSGLRDYNGLQTSVERNQSGIATAIISPTGVRTSLSVDAASNLVSATGPDGVTTTYRYDDKGALQSVAGGSNATGYVYGADGKLQSLIGSFGGTTSYQTIDTSDGSTTTQTTPTGEVVSLVFRRLPSGAQSVTTTLGAGGRVTAVDTPDGLHTVTTSDGTSITRSETPDPQFGLQAPLTALTVRLPSGLTRVSTTKRGVEGQDPSDIFNVFATTDSFTVNGRVRTLTYDRSEQTVKIKSSENRTANLDVDALGRITDVSVAGEPSISTDYDPSGRVTRIGIGSHSYGYEYDASGRRTRVFGSGGVDTHFIYNAGGQLTGQQFADGRAINYGYDSTGNIALVRTPSGSEFGLQYTQGALSTLSSPDSARLSVVSFRYDSTGRMVGLRRSPSDSLRWLYVPGSPDVVVVGATGDTAKQTYNANTRLLSKTERVGGASLSYQYDGTLPTVVQWSGAISGSLRLGYDPDLRLTTEAVGNETPISFAYDGDNLLARAGALTLSRDPLNGRVSGTALGSIQTGRHYSVNGTLDSLWATVNGQLLYSVAYQADDLERIVARHEIARGQVDDLAFAYDSAGRLSSVSRNASPSSSYDYDVNGNRLRLVEGSSITIETVNQRDQLLTSGSASYTYNPAGSVASKQVGTALTTYRYDDWQQLKQVLLPDATRVEYRFDGQSRRVARSVNGATTDRWMYNGALQIVAQLDATGVPTSRFVYGELKHVPDYMIRSGRTYRFILDERGSVHLVVDSQDGTIAQQIDYDPQGRITANTNPGFQPFGFAGGLQDNLTGLVHFGLREYDPSIGRWLSIDPLLLAAGDANLYRYVEGDPINRVDPSGREGTVAELVNGMSFQQQLLTISAVTAGAALLSYQVNNDSWGGTYTPIADPNGNPTPDEKCQNQQQGWEHGCMECGSPVPNDKGGTSWWNNHIPPKSIYTLLNMTGGFCLGPHCERCSGQQGGFIRAFRDWLSERGRSTEEIMEFVLDQAERWF